MGFADGESALRSITWTLYQTSKVDGRRTYREAFEVATDATRAAAAAGELLAMVAGPGTSATHLLQGEWYELRLVATNGADIESAEVTWPWPHEPIRGLIV